MTNGTPDGRAEQTHERLHALDAVRAGALLLGIVLHAALSFFTTPIWVVRDVAPSESLTVTFFVIHIFRMSLFFLLAGFFARMMLERKGAAGFVGDRLKRVALPLVVFWPILFAAFIAVVIWAFQHAAAAQVAAGGPPLVAPPPPPPPTAETFPLTHLWFLYVLLWLYGGALALRGLSHLVDRGGAIGRGLDVVMRRLVRSGLAAPVLAVPVAILFATTPGWIVWGGVPTPDYGLVPNPIALTTFGLAFGFGWLLHRQIGLLQVWRAAWPLHLIVAILATAAMQASLRGLLPIADPKLSLTLQTGLYALAIWTWSFGLIGLALQCLNARNGMVRYLADASYWIYLVHLPIVVALQVVVSQWTMHPLAKFAIIVVGAMAICVASYQLLVRHTFLGSWLSGGKRKTKTAEAVAA